LQYRFVDYNSAGDDNSGVVYDVSRNWHFFNPKAGITWQPSADHQVYGSVAIGHREPNRDDIIDAPITPKPERMYNIEAGYRLLSANFPITVNYYMMYYDNQLVLTGRLNDVGNPVKANVPVSYRTGIELSGAYHLVLKQNNASKVVPNNILSIEGNLTYSLNRILEFDEFIYTYDENYTPIDTLTQIITHSNSTIAFSPSVIASLGLTIRPLKGFELSLINKAVSKQYLDNTSNEDRKLKPFYYTNLRASYQLPLQRTDKEIKFTLLCNNIFNSLFENNGYTFSERYTYTDEFNQLQVTPTSTYNYYYPQAGFNFLVRMNVRF
jgi:iron complex outermembrane receptor protein